MIEPSTLCEEHLCQFLEAYGDDRLRMQMLFFWSRHPMAKFTVHAITGALDSSRSEVNRALADMVNLGLVDVYSYSGVTFYGLTASEERRRPIVELATSDLGILGVYG